MRPRPLRDGLEVELRVGNKISRGVAHEDMTGPGQPGSRYRVVEITFDHHVVSHRA